MHASEDYDDIINGEDIEKYLRNYFDTSSFGTLSGGCLPSWKRPCLSHLLTMLYRTQVHDDAVSLFFQPLLSL